MAKTASMRPKRSIAARGHRLDLVPLGDVAAHRERPLLAAELADELFERLQPSRRQHQPIGVRGSPRRRGPDPAASPRDQQNRISHPPILSADFVFCAPYAPKRANSAGRWACDNRQLVDPQRKRKIRLVVALGVAVLLAVALVYTSFSASTEAKEPSQLLSAAPGTSYDLTGRVVQGLGRAPRRRAALPRRRPRRAAARASRSPTAAPSRTRSAAVARSSSPAKSPAGSSSASATRW